MPDIVIVSEAGSLTIVEGSGTVYGVSVVNANGFAGSVAKDTTLPAITLSTTVTGIVKGNGTKISAATAGTDFVLPGGALGTPSSGTLTLCTGLPISTGVSGLGTGAATFLATPSSANLIALLTDETGTGANVFANTPTLVTPNIGVASGTSLTLSGDLVVNGSTVTLNATTLDIADKNITLANVVTPTEITCDGAGITVKSSATDHTLNYVAATAAWTSSENIDLASGKVIKFNGVSVLSATSINKVTVTAPATGSTLTIVDGATLTASATASVSGTNTGDNAINSLYSGLVSNATHTGDATGSTELTVVKINGVLMSGLATGILKNTTTTGVPSIAIAADFPTLNQNSSGTAAGLSATLAVSSGGTGVTTSTGSGANALATSPTLVTPILGVATATSVNKVTLTQPATGSTLTIVDGATLTASATASVSGTNTGDAAINSLYSGLISNATHTGDATGSTALTVVKINGVLMSGLATGILKNTTTTGVPSIATAGTDYVVPSGSITGNSATVTTNANLTGVITSTGNATVIASQTGTGSKFVVDTSPSLITPVLGTPTSGNLANCTFPTLNQNTSGSAASLSATLAVASGGTGVTTSTGSGANALATSPTLVTPILGTPTSGNLANCTFPTLNQNSTGTAAGLSATLAVLSGGTGVTTSSGTGAVILGTSPALTTPTITGLNEVKTAPTISAGVLALNCALGNVFHVSLNAAITSLTFSNIPSSGTAYGLTLAFTADGTARAVTWPAAVKWSGGTAPTLTSTSTKVDIFVLTTWDAGTTWYSMIGGQNF